MNTYKLLFFITLLLSTQVLSTQGIAADKLLTTTVNYKASTKEQLFDGVIEARQKSTISAQVSGRITEINFDVDDSVKKGDVILRIRNTEYKARLENTKAALREANANLKDMQLELKRSTGLYKDKMISVAAHEKTKALLKASEARVAASKANIVEAKEQLNNSVIRAPYSGIVVERHVELGETLQPGTEVMTGFSLEELRVAVDVPQSYINAIRQYATARLIPLETEHKPIAVTNMIIFPFANPKSHTFRVRVNLDKGIKTLYPGMLVKVAFKIDETKRLLVPHSSVVHRSEVIGVYVVDENQKINLRQIRVGNLFDNNIEVLAGLDAGETIAIDPVEAGITLKSQSLTKRSR